MDGMTDPDVAPRRFPLGFVVTWGFAFLAAIAIGAFAPAADQAGWFAVGAGATLLVAFAAELRVGQARGFIFRVAAAAVGGVVLLGALSALFSLAAIVPD
ncbi:hypothetical protein GCM10022219_10700 [Microbacterium oryzae]